MSGGAGAVSGGAEEDPIAALIEREHRLRAELAEIKPALERVVIEQALAVRDDEPRRQRVIRQLYWEVPAVAVSVIRGAFGMDGQVSEAAGPGPELGPCVGCRTTIRAASRSELSERRRSGAVLRCRPCADAELARRWEPDPSTRWTEDVWPGETWLDEVPMPEEPPADDGVPAPPGRRR